MNRFIRPEIRTPQDAVTAVIEKWVSVTQELGYTDARQEELSSVDLLMEDGQSVTLHAPERTTLFKDPDYSPIGNFGYTNSAMATLSDGTTTSVLHINSEQMPHVLSSVAGEYVPSPFTDSGLMRLVLDAKVITPSAAE